MAITLSSAQYTFAQMVGTPYITPEQSALAATIANDQAICMTGSTVTPQSLTSTITGGSGTRTYQWQSSSDNSTWTNISGATSATYSPAPLAAGIYYYRLQVFGGGQTANSNAVRIMATRSLSTPSITLTGPCSTSASNIYSGGAATMTASVPSVAGVLYSWTLPSGLTAKSSTTGNSITFTADSITSSSYTTAYQVTVTETGACNANPVSATATVTAILLPNNSANAQVVAKALMPQSAHGFWIKWKDINGVVYYNLWGSASTIPSLNGITCTTINSTSGPYVSNNGTATPFSTLTYIMYFMDNPSSGGCPTAVYSSVADYGYPVGTTYYYNITNGYRCGQLYPPSGGLLGIGSW